MATFLCRRTAPISSSKSNLLPENPSRIRQMVAHEYCLSRVQRILDFSCGFATIQTFNLNPPTPNPQPSDPQPQPPNTEPQTPNAQWRRRQTTGTCSSGSRQSPPEAPTSCRAHPECKVVLCPGGTILNATSYDGTSRIGCISWTDSVSFLTRPPPLAELIRPILDIIPQRTALRALWDLRAVCNPP